MKLDEPLPDPMPETLEERLERLRPQLKRVLRSYDVPLEDAEDVLQEAFLDALRKWDTIRYKDAWLLGALRCKCSNYWKKRRSRIIQAVDLSVLEDLSRPQAPEQEHREVVLDLRTLTRGLGERHRAALWLRFGVGLSAGEVARRLGYCPASIRKLTGRSLARLQRWVAAGADAGTDDDPSSP